MQLWSNGNKHPIHGGCRALPAGRRRTVRDAAAAGRGIRGALGAQSRLQCRIEDCARQGSWRRFSQSRSRSHSSCWARPRGRCRPSPGTRVGATRKREILPPPCPKHGSQCTAVRALRRTLRPQGLASGLFTREGQPQNRLAKGPAQFTSNAGWRFGGPVSLPFSAPRIVLSFRVILQDTADWLTRRGDRLDRRPALIAGADR
jgi:hypothetical protein